MPNYSINVDCWGDAVLTGVPKQVNCQGDAVSTGVPKQSTSFNLKSEFGLGL